jgi:hypothetical protein
MPIAGKFSKAWKTPCSRFPSLGKTWSPSRLRHLPGGVTSTIPALSSCDFSLALVET